MERLQGPINPYLYGENWEMGFSEQGLLANIEQDEDIFSSGLENRMPFLQMLQEAPPLLPLKELGFQTLLKLQHVRDPWEVDELKMGEKIRTFELESCVTHDLMELYSPNKSESNQIGTNAERNCLREGRTSSKQTQLGKSAVLVRERRKRKRAKPLKNKEEVESQRMTHIAVERNRRRQMNDHLNVLRSLMPSSYIQRGDQASIIGGAINFVKELEQLLHSLESHRRTRNPEGSSSAINQSSASSPTSAIAMASNGFFMSLSQHRIPSDDQDKETSLKEQRIGDGVTAENKSETADIEVTVIQTHVNLKIQCERRPRQLVKAIVALEELKLTVLHLNVTTSQSTVLYSFNLKIEDDCKLRSADDIAGSVHQIFSYINGR